MTHNISTEFLMQDTNTKKNIREIFGSSTNPKDLNYSPIKRYTHFFARGLSILLIGSGVFIGGIYGTAKINEWNNDQEYQSLYINGSTLADRIYGNNNQELDNLEKLKWYSSMGISDKKEPTKEQLTVFNGFANAYLTRRNK